MKRHLVATATAAFALAATGALPAAAGTTRPHAAGAPALLTCSNARVIKPASFVISCADANAALSKTHWSNWTAASARGTTRFEMNLCTPNCASSKLTSFPDSAVVASAPVDTKHHGVLFSRLVVRYRLHGVLKTFSMSWKGVPAFAPAG